MGARPSDGTCNQLARPSRRRGACGAPRATRARAEAARAASAAPRRRRARAARRPPRRRARPVQRAHFLEGGRSAQRSAQRSGAVLARACSGGCWQTSQSSHESVCAVVSCPAMMKVRHCARTCSRLSAPSACLPVERRDSSTLGRPGAGCWGRGTPRGCGGGALGCVGAAWALRATGRADGAARSDRADGTFTRSTSWRARPRAGRAGRPTAARRPRPRPQRARRDARRCSRRSARASRAARAGSARRWAARR